MTRHPILRWLACGFATGLLLTGCDRAPTQSQAPAASSAEAIASAEQEFIDRLYVAHIVPGAEAFAASSRALVVAAEDFCGARDATRFAQLQAAWRSAALAWQPLRWLQAGPGTDEHRMLRIDAWPQARLDLVATRVGQMLAAGQPVDADAIANQPVQVRGRPALETLLLEDRGPADFPADAMGDRRCALVVGIAGNLARIATTQHERWLRGAKGGNDANSVFASAGGAIVAPHNVMNLVGNLLMAQLVELKDVAIGAPIGISPNGDSHSPRPRLAHSWRSRASLDRVVASLESVRTMYFGGGDGEGAFGLDDLLAARGAGPAATEFEKLLAAALEQARGLRDEGLTIHEGASDEADRARLVDLRNRVRDLEIHAQLAMMPALDIALTFNFADGD